MAYPLKSEEMLFSKKLNPPYHPPLFLNNCVIKSVKSHKHIGSFLTTTMSWEMQISNMISKTSKRVSALNKLKFRLPRTVLDTIYKSFIRPLLEYADIIWHGCTSCDSQRLERVQYECALTVSGAVRGSSYSSLLAELGWERLSDRRHVHSLVMFYKIVNGHTRQYLKDLIPPVVSVFTSHNLRNKHNLRVPICTTSRYQKSFIPYATQHWNGLDTAVRSLSFSLYKKHLMKLVRPSINKHFSYGPRYTCALLTRLRIGTCSLNQSLFIRNLASSPACNCGCRCEGVVHFLLYCPTYQQYRTIFFDNLQNLLGNSLDFNSLSESARIHLLLRGSTCLSYHTNCSILKLTQLYIVHTKRFATTL
ncbi:uncharacterized protein LOC118414720 isoform X1 [Branchiostoma floridae]|uniref:Uncharacterized protein LOC118414720 isoform X1 n=1 Tax=Branchiostoma floridae TaxID=7739 RepID=A0A9J7MPG9_BRAFL|nr:uncharacterized protein LOC118414720 isoform X1 [Branchiostoma floridae]XP_035674812.1 uncharacterized protein LOC118414720 isoform X1 [Branchiostoma floridae]XP_035674813.1 uncharacterized protein LOC118414720 isoform X1 [Branchiostoma floridae]